MENKSFVSFSVLHLWFLHFFPTRIIYVSVWHLKSTAKKHKRVLWKGSLEFSLIKRSTRQNSALIFLSSIRLIKTPIMGRKNQNPITPLISSLSPQFNQKDSNRIEISIPNGKGWLFSTKTSLHIYGTRPDWVICQRATERINAKLRMTLEINVKRMRDRSEAFEKLSNIFEQCSSFGWECRF